MENTWRHIHQAALQGLPKRVLSDQAMTHCSGFRGLLCLGAWRIELRHGQHAGVAGFAVANLQDRVIGSAGAFCQRLDLHEIQSQQIVLYFFDGGNFGTHKP